MVSLLGMANKKPFSLMPKNSQYCGVRTGDSVSVSGDVLRMQLPAFHAVTKSELSWLWVTASLHSAGSACPTVMSPCNLSGW